jgi:hypothetical protein
VLAHGLREPGRPWDALHGAGGVGRAVEVLEGLDEGVVVRAARRRAAVAQARQCLCAREEPYPAVRIERVWLVDADVGAGLSGIIEADISTCSSTANDVATAQVG